MQLMVFLVVINMITDFIISIIVLPVYSLFSVFSLPVVGNIAIPDDAFEALKKILTNIGYIVPLEIIIPIFLISAVLDHFTAIWALILRIKSFIPTMGR